MRKILCLALAMILAMGSALAEVAVRFGDPMEVVKCEEFITLRAEPSTKAEALDRVPLGAMVRTLGPHDEQFSRVLYEGRAGYVLNEYLGRVQTTAVAYADVDVEEGSQEYYNVNLFLTNFTEQHFGSPYGYFEADAASDAELVQFAIPHICYNRPDDMEWGDWGDDGNVRLSDDGIAEVCEKYFGREPASLQPLDMNYIDGYYYWFDIGKLMPGGFAQMFEIERVGADSFRVDFSVYGQGYGWDEDVYWMGFHELHEAHPEYFSKYQPRGCAVFSVGEGGDLTDRSTWKLESICMEWEV